MNVKCRAVVWGICLVFNDCLRKIRISLFYWTLYYAIAFFFYFCAWMWVVKIRKNSARFLDCLTYSKALLYLIDYTFDANEFKHDECSGNDEQLMMSGIRMNLN